MQLSHHCKASRNFCKSYGAGTETEPHLHQQMDSLGVEMVRMHGDSKGSGTCLHFGLLIFLQVFGSSQVSSHFSHFELGFPTTRNHSTGGHHLNFTLMVQQLEMFQLPWSQRMTCLGSKNHLQPVGDGWLDAAGGCWFILRKPWLFRSRCRIFQESGNYLKASSIWKDATETCCMMFGKQILQKHPAWLKPT